MDPTILQAAHLRHGQSGRKWICRPVIAESVTVFLTAHSGGYEVIDGTAELQKGMKMTTSHILSWSVLISLYVIALNLQDFRRI